MSDSDPARSAMTQQPNRSLSDDLPRTESEPAYDCRQCGACCHQREGTILVVEADLVRWRRSGRDDLLAALTPGHFGEMAFAMKPSGSCVHLGKPDAPNDCSIYADRATVCRTFQAGTWQCREFRRDRGIP